MKLGRIELATPDGPAARLVAVDPEAGTAVDLAAAERLRLERRGATTRAAARLARARFSGSLRDALEQGDEFLDAARQALGAGGAEGATLGLDGLSWLPACDPTVLRDCIAFEQHLKTSAERLGTTMNPLHYERPGYYKGSVAGLIGHEREVPWPSYTRQMDYELELGLVVGKAGRNLDPTEAVEHIFGATILDDFSARDIQVKEKALAMGPAKAKDFASALGPWVVTRDELDLDALTMVARIDGEEWSRGSTADLMWKPGELLAYISRGETILPGDVIGTGTVGGGCGLELGRYLEPGAVVELEVSGIGVLRNRIGRPETAGWEPTPRRRS